MQIITRSQVGTVRLPGRKVQTVVGKDAFSKSSRMTMGFATYSEESGPMEPHNHAEEICYILSSQGGSLRKGPGKDKLDERIPLEPGMTLHIPPLEWHVFEFEPGGHVDIIFFYGQVDNLRPEEIQRAGNKPGG